MLLGLYIWETNLIETLTNLMPIDEIVFAVSCSVTVTDEFELQLTKTGDKARNWMTMFQNWSTKDEIETSIRTFQSVRNEIKNYFSKIEWRDDENGRENLYYLFMQKRKVSSWTEKHNSLLNQCHAVPHSFKRDDTLRTCRIIDSVTRDHVGYLYCLPLHGSSLFFQIWPAIY